MGSRQRLCLLLVDYPKQGSRLPQTGVQTAEELQWKCTVSHTIFLPICPELVNCGSEQDPSIAVHLATEALSYSRLNVTEVRD